MGAGPAAQGPVEGTLALGIRNLIGLAEAYPELKASDNFAQLQAELASIEERISITRRVYNDTVETLNTAVAVFPQSLVASAFRFGPREFFRAGDEASAAPTVAIGGRS
jgi:LemA protein